MSYDALHVFTHYFLSIQFAFAEMPLLEIAACASYALSVWLAARNNIHTWWIGLVGCVLYGLLFWQVKLYANVTLQLFFILTSIIGWIFWSRGQQAQASPISRTTRFEGASYFIAALAVTGIYGLILHSFTEAYVPFLDSAILAFSLLAQLLLMRRKIETWYIWILVNTIAIPLYASRELYLTSLLYLIFWFNAWYGLYRWRKEITQ